MDNAGTGSLVYSLSENLSWLSLSPSGCLFPNACLTPPGPDVITASYDAALLPAGRYSGTISVSSVGATNSVVDLPVQLDVVGLPVVSLVPNPTDIDAGGSSTLSWSSSDADSCAAVGGWTASTGISGSQLVSPSITTTYTISCTGLAGTTQASAQVTVAPPPALVNDACLEATAVESDPFAESLDTSLASQSPDDPVPGCGLGPDGATVWYAYTPPASGEALVSTETSDYDTVVSVWPAAEGCGALETPVACNDDGTIGAQSRLLFHVDAGITYLVQVGDRNSGPGGQLEVLFIPEPDRGLLATAALVALALSHRVRRRARRE